MLDTQTFAAGRMPTLSLRIEGTNNSLKKMFENARLQSVTTPKYADRIFRNAIQMNSHRKPLWLHAFLVALSIFLLVDLGCWKFPVGLAFLLMMGAGDGYPSVAMQISGGIIFALMVAAIILLLIFFFTFLRRLITDGACPRSQKAWLMSGVLCVSAWSFFIAWKAGAVDRVDSAILADNVVAYEKAVKWRVRMEGDIDSDLYFAARMGQLQMVKHLISEGANPNSKLGGNGDSVLRGSIPNVMNRPDGNKPVVEYLKSHGATN